MLIVSGGIFVLGVLVGSFVNVVIYRLPLGLNFVRGRSFCPRCKRKIKWFDNVPLLSFFLLKGRCRFCRSPISWRYPIVEALTACLFVLAFSQISLIGLIGLIFSLILISGLIIIFFIDLEHQIIPDEIIFPLVGVFLVYYLFTSPQLLITNYLITGLVSFLLFLLLLLITRGRGMGFGDVKFAFLIGLVLGFPKVIVAFYVAFLTGAFCGVILLLAGRARFGQKIPFGPFLSLGMLTAYLWGKAIISLIPV